MEYVPSKRNAVRVLEHRWSQPYPLTPPIRRSSGRAIRLRSVQALVGEPPDSLSESGFPGCEDFQDDYNQNGQPILGIVYGLAINPKPKPSVHRCPRNCQPCPLTPRSTPLSAGSRGRTNRWSRLAVSIPYACRV